MAVATRTQTRASMELSTRVWLVENDADTFEEKLESFGATLSKILWAMVGILVSLSTSIILLFLNLVTR